MMGRLKALKTKGDNDSMTLSPTSVMLSLPLSSATVELVPQSNEMILKGKLSSCVNDTQTQRSSKMLGVGLTSKEKDYKPYWFDLCGVISSRLLLPVETGCVDSDLNYSNLWQNKTVGQSWFSQILYIVQNPNLQPIFLPSFTSSVAECTDSEVIARKSKKIRLFLNSDQRALLKQWFGVSRYVYNTTIKYLQQPGTKANWKAIKTEIYTDYLNGLSLYRIKLSQSPLKMLVKPLVKLSLILRKLGRFVDVSLGVEKILNSLYISLKLRLKKKVFITPYWVRQS